MSARRNTDFADGYQAALHDIINEWRTGGERDALDWIGANAGTEILLGLVAQVKAQAAAAGR